MNKINVTIELDCQRVTNSVSITSADVLEYGVIIKKFKDLLNIIRDSKVCFFRRKEYLVAHALARISRGYASPQF